MWAPSFLGVMDWFSLPILSFLFSVLLFLSFSCSFVVLSCDWMAGYTGYGYPPRGYPRGAPVPGYTHMYMVRQLHALFQPQILTFTLPYFNLLSCRRPRLMMYMECSRFIPACVWPIRLSPCLRVARFALPSPRPWPRPQCPWRNTTPSMWSALQQVLLGDCVCSNKVLDDTGPSYFGYKILSHTYIHTYIHIHTHTIHTYIHTYIHIHLSLSFFLSFFLSFLPSFFIFFLSSSYI